MRSQNKMIDKLKTNLLSLSRVSLERLHETCEMFHAFGML